MAKLIETQKFIMASAPLDHNASAMTAEYVSLKGYDHLTIVIQVGAWAGGTAAVSLLEATDVAASGAQALNMDNMWTDVAATGTLVKTAVTADTFNLSTASVGKQYIIEIDANDDFTFFPEGVAVTAGETVTFRVTNTGVIPHDFVLGDEEMQIEHEAEMAEMSGDMAMHDEPNAFVLEPGETKEMTWHMTATGDVLFGCHQTGHYAAGMKGTVIVAN